jgi:hypothetical protein
MKYLIWILLASSGVAHAADPLSVSIFHLDPAKRDQCAPTVDEFLKLNGVDPNSKEAEGARNQVCVNRIETIVLMVPKKPEESKRVFTIDLTGSTTSGNTDTAIVGGNIRYADEFATRHKIDLTLKGEYRLESDGSTFDSFELNGNYDFVLGKHWSLFGYASIGRDTKKQIALVANEIGGVTYNFFANSERRSLKLSVGVGHRHEELVDGTIPRTDNPQAFTNDNMMAHYRLRFERKFLKDAVSLIAGVWFQHILYSPGTSDTAARYADFSDFRLISDLTLRVTIAEIHGVKVTANFGGSYEYFAVPVTDSDYDLTLKGGIGLSF